MAKAAEDEKAIWVHSPSNSECVQLFEQSLSPIETYNYQRLQMDKLSTLAQFEFRAVKGLEHSQAMRIRRILDPEWVAFSYNNHALIWCFPPQTEESKIEYIEDKLRVLGFEVLKVKEEDRQTILSHVSKDVPPVELITITELPDAGTPISLERRGFWIFKDLPLLKELDEQGAMDLVNSSLLMRIVMGLII